MATNLFREKEIAWQKINHSSKMRLVFLGMCAEETDWKASLFSIRFFDAGIYDISIWNIIVHIPSVSRLNFESLWVRETVHNINVKCWIDLNLNASSISRVQSHSPEQHILCTRLRFDLIDNLIRCSCKNLNNGFEWQTKCHAFGNCSKAKSCGKYKQSENLFANRW